MSMHKSQWHVAFAVWFAAAFMALTARAAEPNAIHVSENSIKMQLVYVPPGDFDMGSPKSELSRWKGRFGEFLAKDGFGEFLTRDEGLHRVRLTGGFYLGAHEVTQTQFQQILGRNPARFSKTGVAKGEVSGKDTSSYPVESITCYDAVEFCNSLSKKEELPEFYTLREVEREGGSIINADVTENGGDGYRLPTVAEWEYACRAGSDTSYSCGNDIDELWDYAWFYYNSRDTTQPVGKKRPNAWGLFDMHGNVWEWCNDWYAEYDGDATNPHGPDSGEKRELRGGSYYNPPEFTRSASRSSNLPSDRTNYAYGFRVARNAGLLPPPPVVQQPVQTAPDMVPSSPNGLSPAAATTKHWRSVGLVVTVFVACLVLAGVVALLASVGAYSWRTDETVDVYEERNESTSPNGK